MLRDLFSVKGSFGRREWWFAQLAIIVIGGFLVMFVHAASAAITTTIQPIKIVNATVMCACVFAMFWVAILSHLKRMRDMGVAWGWIFLLFVPVIDTIFFLCLGFAPGKKANQQTEQKINMKDDFAS